MGFMKTNWVPLIVFYILIAVITIVLGHINTGLVNSWLGANLIFFGFIIWFERPFIPILKKNTYLSIIASTLIITMGLFIACLK